MSLWVRIHDIKDFAYAIEALQKILKIPKLERKFALLQFIFICVSNKEKMLKTLFTCMQVENGCGLLIWKGEVCANKISNAISAKADNGFDEKNYNFVARVERKLDATEIKLDGVKHIKRELIGWAFIFCCSSFVAYMAHGK